MSDQRLLPGNCPNCQKPTQHIYRSGSGTLNYPPVYDEDGMNINTDQNTITHHYVCLECKKGFSIITQGGE